ncbi:MAG: triacylglycerol lipase [Flavobacteriales bacterium]|jgi:triacylglycerol lipase
MMKKSVYISAMMLAIGLSVFQASAQIKAGFDIVEARDLLAICNSFTFLELYGSDESILPAGFKKVYTSRTMGMDNKFQIYEHGDVAVINFRGSTEKTVSWIENIYSAMIPAQGTIMLEGYAFNYAFAKDTAAAVHSGYALALADMSETIIHQIKDYNDRGIYQIMITGHSQGGALAQLLRSYLENLPNGVLSENNTYKTYAFAHPMIGNQEFASEYEATIASTGTSFSIINPADPIPRMPLAYEEGGIISEKDIASLLFDRDNFHTSEVAIGMAARLFESKLNRLVQFTGNNINGNLSSVMGDVSMPDYVDGINFAIMGERIEMRPFEYPLILSDSTIFQTDSLMAINPMGADGHFINKELYAGPPSFWHHKPYNYYSAFLKMYFPMLYADLRWKHLPENL